MQWTTQEIEFRESTSENLYPTRHISPFCLSYLYSHEVFVTGEILYLFRILADLEVIENPVSRRPAAQWS
jgi:hypothetical protein